MRTWIVAAVFAAMGCSDDAPMDPMFCEVDCAEFPLDFRVESGATLIPVVEDGNVPVVMGFQGGVMIRPAGVLTGVPVERGDIVHVAVDISPAPSGEFARFTRQMTVRTGPDGLLVGPVDDQIAWDPPAEGYRTQLTMTVRGVDFVATATANVSLVSASMTPASCEPFEQQPGACSYRIIPGTVTVEAVGTEGTPDGCTDPRYLTIAFVADDPSNAMQCFDALGGFASPPPTTFRAEAACLDTAGIGMGSEVEARWRIIEQGTCSPSFFDPDPSLADCAC